MIAAESLAQNTSFVYRPAIDEAEIADVIQSVDCGEIDAILFGQIEDGIVEYRTVTDWTIFVYFDKNKWVYVDSVIAPDGREVDIDDIQGSLTDNGRPMPYVGSYKPKTVLTKARWGIINITSTGGVS